MATVKKETVKKTPVKATKVVKKVTAKAAVSSKVEATIPVVKATESKAASRTRKAVSKLSAPIFDLTGKAAGTHALPEEVFGAVVNKSLLSQAMRVYMSNQKGHFSNTKTRGEVRGSTRKIYKQKGTGSARHGAKRAPIFVGGGIALGPKFRKIELKLPQKMKTAALVSALSLKARDAELAIMSDIEKVTGKTSQMAKFVNTMSHKSLLFVAGDENRKIGLALRNLQNIELSSPLELNAYDAMRYKTLILTKEAVSMLQKRVLGEVAKEVPAKKEAK